MRTYYKITNMLRKNIRFKIEKEKEKSATHKEAKRRKCN